MESARALGHWLRRSQALTCLAEIALDRGWHAEAALHAREALAVQCDSGNRFSRERALRVPDETGRGRRAAFPTYARP